MRSPITWPTRSRARRSLILPALLALVSGQVSASGGDAENPPPIPPQKDTAKDYAPFPALGPGYVTDLAHLLSNNEREQIQHWLWQVEKKTGVEIAVVTIGSIRDYPGAPNSSIEAFATGLFNKYGIGSLPANNGVLLLVAARDRKARIELGAGYGRARDADAARIISGVIVPRFRKGAYGKGVTEGVKAIAEQFAGQRIMLNWRLLGCLIAVPLVGLIAYSLFRSGKRGWGWVCAGFLVALTLAVVYMVIKILSILPRGSDGGWGSGGWSAGGFGGGFGGGFSGGGGATGSW